MNPNQSRVKSDLNPSTTNPISLYWEKAFSRASLERKRNGKQQWRWEIGTEGEGEKTNWKRGTSGERATEEKKEEEDKGIMVILHLPSLNKVKKVILDNFCRVIDNVSQLT